MKKIFELYGDVILMVAIIVALVIIIVALCAIDGPVHDLFLSLVKNGFAKMDGSTGLTPVTPTP